MTSRSRPFCRFSRRARAASCAIVRPPVSSMKNGRCCSSIATSLIFSKSRSLMPPRRIVLDGMPLCSAMMRVASCSADISSEKKPTMPPLTVLIWPSALHLAAPGARDVVGDVGGERGLAHAGTAGDDDQVGRLQAAHLAVEILEAGREARELAVALIGARRHVDRGGERGLEFLEAAVVAAGLGELVEPALGVLDLLARREIDRRVEGDIDHVLADLDQLAPDREVVDRAAVVHRVDDGGRFGGEAGEILRDASCRRCRRRRAGRSSASPARRACRCGSGCARYRRSADGSARRNAAARENRRRGRAPRC